jgi:hypothetical protein
VAIIRAHRLQRHPSGFRAPSAHQIDDKADQQNQAEPSSANGRPADVKAAAAKQEKKNNDEK